MFDFFKAFFKWLSVEQEPAINPLVMEKDLGRLKEQVLLHFPEAYARSFIVQDGPLWSVYQSRRHHPFSHASTELEAWQDAAKWIPYRN